MRPSANFLESFLLTPWYLHFLWLIPIVIILYLLKLRRTQVVISSTLLWLKSMQDLTANAPFQRLRRNLLMFLQILVLLALAIALARPYVRSATVAGQSYCVLIDNSASMQTKEGEKTRLELAREKALEMVDQMDKGDKMMVVAFSHTADVLCELSDDKVSLRQTIRGIGPTGAATNIRDALLMAHSLTLTQRDLHVVVIGDGNIADLDRIGTRDIELSFVQVGASTDNAGIVAFSVRDPEEGQRAGTQQSFVLVHNESATPLDGTLTLYHDDDAIAIEELHVDAQADGELAFDHSDLGEGMLRVELDHRDALAVDNVAWIALRPTTIVRTLLVTDPEATSAYFLRRVLSGDARVELSTISPEFYEEADDFDLVIFDGFAPESPPPGSLMYVNVLPSLEGLSAEGVVENPPIVAVDREHPAMRFLNPSNVGITEAKRLALPEGARTLMSTTGGALLADCSRGGQQILVLAFDIGQSDWPLKLSFPLFFQNLVSWTPTGAMASESSVSAGKPITLPPSQSGGSATVVAPDGSRETVPLDPGRAVYYANTRQTGVYTVERDDGTEQYAVNLLDANESAIRPEEKLTFGAIEIAAERELVRQNHELWRWFVLCGLGVLCIEWWVYSRRAWL